VRAAGGQGGWQRHAGEEFRGGVAGGSAVPHHQRWGEGVGWHRRKTTLSKDVTRCGRGGIRNGNLGTGI
jgi:hypothetical protein